jgi:molybdopterin/thiamine biosynthesis adenylyltransferase
MKQINVFIVGAGGVASYLVPVLSKFQIADVSIMIMDGDTLEERNIDRQLFKEDEIGVNKAEALAHKYGAGHVNEYLTANNTRSVMVHQPDVIMCLVDNDEGRKQAYMLCKEFKIPFLTAANELFDASARFIHPDWHGTDKCLLKVNPDIMNPSPTEGINCTGRMAEQFPQLAIANHAAASLLLHLFYIHFIEEISEDIKKDYAPSYFSRTLMEYTSNVDDRQI